MWKTRLALTLSIILAACAEQEGGPPAVTPAVEVAVAVERQFSPEHRFVGLLESFDDAVIFTRVDGLLQERHFVEGATVQVGQPLFSLDPRELAATLAQRRAELDAAVVEAQFTDTLYERGRPLRAAGHISATELERLQSAAAQAAAEADSARAKVMHAETRLDYASITAPFTGRISATDVAVGELVQAARTPLATLVSLDPIYATFHVDEKTRSLLLGQGAMEEFAVDLINSDGTRYPQQGKLVYIDNRIDSSSGTLLLKAAFENPDQQQLPGEHVTVAIRPKESATGLAIPQAAVRQTADGETVFVVADDSTVRETPVTTGLKLGADVVVSGLREASRVVVAGLHQVRDGVTVRVRERADD